MIEKLICIVLIAFLWLFAFNEYCDIANDYKNVLNRYNTKIEQEITINEDFRYD